MTSLFPVVILAGGLATRLRPMTETLPKSLVPVHHKPFIAHQLLLLKQNNITDVVICLGYLGEQVVAYLEKENHFGLNISFTFDGTQLLGTAGAIKKALPLLQDNFFVLYGDSYLPCHFAKVQDAFLEQKRPGLMTVYHNNNIGDTSNVSFVEGKILNYDKQNVTSNMLHIDYGLGIFNQIAFETVPENQPFDLATLYQYLLQKRLLAAFEVKERFYEVGSFTGIKALEYYLTSSPRGCVV